MYLCEQKDKVRLKHKNRGLVERCLRFCWIPFPVPFLIRCKQPAASPLPWQKIRCLFVYIFIFMRERLSLAWKILGLVEGNSVLLQTRRLCECQILRMPVGFPPLASRTLGSLPSRQEIVKLFSEKCDQPKRKTLY